MKALVVANIVLALGLFLVLGMQAFDARTILLVLRLQAEINREQMAINAELRRLVEQLAAERGQ